MTDRQQQTPDRPPIAPPSLADAESFAAAGDARPNAGDCFVRTAFGACDLAGSRAADLRFEEVTFTGTSLRGVVWQGAQLVDVRLRGCDLSNADLRQASLHRVEFISCNLTGANLSNVQCHHVRFERCKMVLAHAAQAKLAGCALGDCLLEQADLAEADLREAALTACNLRRARLVGAKLAGCDLRGSDLTDLGATPFELRGAIVEAGQLVQLAPLLGVEVRYPLTCLSLGDAGRKILVRPHWCQLRRNRAN